MGVNQSPVAFAYARETVQYRLRCQLATGNPCAISAFRLSGQDRQPQVEVAVQGAVGKQRNPPRQTQGI
ncbi:MAG: hypothetical protein GY726_06025, partial [Proteobacteria bacterium]|nr:hypothetical protein [Pseudomonadota bacterium]